MRLRFCAALLILAASAWLVGCGLLGGNEPPGPPTVKAQIVPPLTVVADASANRAEEYTFDFGDGTDPVVSETGIVRHTYGARGRYAIIVYLQAPGFGGGGGGGGPAIGGGGVPGAGQGLNSAYIVVDLLGPMPQAVILTFNQYGKPTADIYAYLPLVLYGEASSDPAGGGLWYQWELVRVDPTTLQPIPYPPHADGYQPGVEYIRSQEMNWTVYLRGPGGCSPIPWLWRLTLTITDQFNRQHTVVRYVYVW